MAEIDHALPTRVPCLKTRRRVSLLVAPLWPVGATVLAWVALLVRPVGTRPWQALWAEDGAVFLNGALWHEAPAIWFRPYDGYLHLVPRLIATLAAAIPLSLASEVFAAISAAIAAMCLVLLAWGLRRWLETPWIRTAFVACLVLVDGAAQEIDANAANLHWFLGLGMLGLALIRPTRTHSAVAAATVGLVFALTEILGVFAVVVAVTDAAARRSHDRAQEFLQVWLVSAAMAAGIAVQVCASWASPRAVPTARAIPDPSEIGSWYLRNVVGRGVAPQLTEYWTLPELAGLLTIVAAGLLALGLLARRQGLRVRSRSIVGVTLVALSVAYFASSVVVNRGLADRYLDLPAVLLVAGILVLAAGRRRWQSAVFIVIVLTLCAAESHTFSTHPRITQAASWTRAWQRAVATQCHDGATTARVAIAPTSRQDPRHAQWTVTVPCPH